jgi:hypothetical protein
MYFRKQEQSKDNKTLMQESALCHAWKMNVVIHAIKRRGSSRVQYVDELHMQSEKKSPETGI